MTISCDYCNKQLTELGGLLFDAPNTEGMTHKYHACNKCFAKFTPKPEGSLVSIDNVTSLGLKVATIKTAERVGGSDKLIKLELDDGGEGRTILAGIGLAYETDALLGRQIVIVGNLAPRTMMGQVSQGMLLAASGESGPVLLMPEGTVESGSSVG